MYMYIYIYVPLLGYMGTYTRDMGIYSMGSITPRMLIQMDKKMADEQDTVIASGGI